MSEAKTNILDDAIGAWKAEAAPETLSDGARTRLFSQIREVAPGRLGAWRWVLLGAVPVVAAAALMVLSSEHPGARSQATLSVAKVDGEVVFTLHNGSRAHEVYRATDPRAIDDAKPVKMTGNQYRDEATGGPNLVFYKID